MKIQIIATVALMLTIGSTQAQDNTWSGITKIEQLRVWDGTQIMGNAADLSVVGSCGSQSPTTSGFILDGDPSDPIYAFTASVLLAAQTSGARVQLLRTGACNAIGSFALINGVKLVD